MFDIAQTGAFPDLYKNILCTPAAAVLLTKLGCSQAQKHFMHPCCSSAANETGVFPGTKTFYAPLLLTKHAKQQSEFS